MVKDTFHGLLTALQGLAALGLLVGWIAALLEMFGEDRLEASGIAERGEDGQWKLAPSLASAAVLMALRKASSDPPFEILAGEGGLVKSEPPIVAALRDHEIKDLVSKTGHRLLACRSTDQIPAFLSQALPATLLGGLQDLNAKELRRISRVLERPILGPNPGDGGVQNPVKLILVDWDPVAIRATQFPEIRRAADFLADAERHLRVDTSCCGVWSPEESELEKYRFCRNVGDRSAARETLVESMDLSTYTVSAYADEDFISRKRPEDFAEAYIELERCIAAAERDSTARRRLREAEETFASFVETDLVQPMREQYLNSSDPLQRILGCTAAEATGSLHRQAPYLAKDILALAKGSLSLGEQKRVAEQVKQRSREVGNLIQLAKVLRR